MKGSRGLVWLAGPNGELLLLFLVCNCFYFILYITHCRECYCGVGVGMDCVRKVMTLRVALFFYVTVYRRSCCILRKCLHGRISE